MAGNARQSGQSVTLRALSVLSTFNSSMVRQSLSQIARRSGLPVATCHRLVQDLLAWGALERHQDGLYTIGGRLAQIGLLAPVQNELRQVAAPILQDVLFATRQVVNLQVRDGNHALVLDRLAGTRMGIPIMSPGQRVPMHLSAGGKVLLAFDSSSEKEGRLKDPRRNRIEDVAEYQDFEMMLEQVRERGFATTEETLSTGSYGLAVPVFDQTRQVIAALGIVSFTPIRSTREIAPVLQVASSSITRALSHRRTW